MHNVEAKVFFPNDFKDDTFDRTLKSVGKLFQFDAAERD